MSEITHLTYDQRNQDLILNKEKKVTIKMTKRD